MRQLTVVLTLAISFALFILACDSEPTGPDATPEPSPSAEATAQPPSEGSGTGVSGGPFTFAPPVFDIATGPNGNLLVPETVFPGNGVPEEGATSTSTVWEIRQNGDPRPWAQVTTVEGSPINGIEANGQSDLLLTSGSPDEAVGAGLWQVSRKNQRVLGDIETFEKENDPDLKADDAWKDAACAAASGPFTPGPQSNPYHLTSEAGGTFLVADAAGNTLLRVKRNGRVELVALFTPPTEEGTGSDAPEDWLEFPFSGAEDGSCFVQPVPNSVAIGPDGAIYVGELTGVDFTTSTLTPLGVSRVWRIDPGARDVTCPSAACEVAFTGFTSILDVAFGPDGELLVVEFDENGWLTPFGVGSPAGGTINACTLESGECTTVTEDLHFPAAITVDKWGDLWLLENSLDTPTVKKVE